MSTRELRFTTHIHGSPETIFDLVADMPNYGRWLPDSSAFGGTVEVTPYPVRLGTTYLDTGQFRNLGRSLNMIVREISPSTMSCNCGQARSIQMLTLVSGTHSMQRMVGHSWTGD